MRLRAERLLKDRPAPHPAEEERRVLRGMAVLEYAATLEARKLLQELAQGEADALRTRRAKATLDRLHRGERGRPVTSSPGGSVP